MQNCPRKVLPSISHEKLLESIVYGGGGGGGGGERHYALSPLENHVGVYARLICAKKQKTCELKLVSILNLTKRIV